MQHTFDRYDNDAIIFLGGALLAYGPTGYIPPSGLRGIMGGLLPKIDRLRRSHFRPVAEYDLEWVAVLMYRASAFKLFDTTYPFLPPS